MVSDHLRRLGADHSVTTFGERLRDAREAARMTQEELGFALGVTNSAVSGWERGREVPSFALLSKLRGLVKISLDELICGDQPYAMTAAPPTGVREPAHPRSRARRERLSSPDDATLEVALQAILMSLIENTPASAGSFVENVDALVAQRKAADGAPLSKDDAVLGPLLYIARQARKKRAAEHPLDLLRDAVQKPK